MTDLAEESQKVDALPDALQGSRHFVLEPQQDGHRRGTSDRYTMRRSAYTRAVLSDVGRVLPFIAAGAFVAASLRAMRKAS